MEYSLRAESNTGSGRNQDTGSRGTQSSKVGTRNVDEPKNGVRRRVSTSGYPILIFPTTYPPGDAPLDVVLDVKGGILTAPKRSEGRFPVVVFDQNR